MKRALRPLLAVTATALRLLALVAAGGGRDRARGREHAGGVLRKAWALPYFC
jgi:hypothetical protein